MTFTLTIEIGNAEMRYGDQVARALRGVANRLEEVEPELSGMLGVWMLGVESIRDANGNTVGEWRVTG